MSGKELMKTTARSKREASAEILERRNKLLQNIVVAHAVVEWAGLPLTSGFVAWLENYLDELQKDAHTALDHAEKPISTGDQMEYRGRCGASNHVIAYLKALSSSVNSALSEAADYERDLAVELGMHYIAPPWGDQWHEEARRWMEIDADRKSETA